MKLIADWPAQSPDLNPIEHCWAWMKHKLQGKSFASQDELWDALVDLWEGFPTEFTNNLIDSLPERVAAVIAANGGNTRY